MKHKEVWKRVRGFGGYEVSNFGRVKRRPRRVVIYYRGRAVQKREIKEKYLKPVSFRAKTFVTMYKGQRPMRVSLKKLVALYFLPETEYLGNNPGVIFKDGNPHNFKVSNLKWAVTRGRRPIPIVCLNNGKRFPSMKDACEYYSIDKGNMSKHLQGKRKFSNGLKFRIEK